MKKLHAQLASRFYDKIIKLHHDEFNYSKIHYKKWLNLLAAKLKKGNIVLDLGCGNGRAIKYFIDKGYQGIGVDVSSKMLILAKKHVPEAKFYKKEFAEMNFKPGSIDAVISFFALNHIPKKEFIKTMGICRRILKKDGFLLLGMVKGNDEGLFEGFYGKKLQLYGAGYTENEIAQILESKGFNIRKIGLGHFKGQHFEEDDIYVLAQARR